MKKDDVILVTINVVLNALIVIGLILLLLMPKPVTNWSDWDTLVEPTCTNVGLETRVDLDDSANTQTRVIPIDEDNHTFGPWVITIEATLTNPGTMERVCIYDSSHIETKTYPLTNPEKESTPNVIIDYLDETLIFSIDGEYLINGTLTTIIGDLDISLFGTTLEIVKTGDGIYTINSDPQTLIIPNRPATPNPTSINPTTLANNDGMIINVDTTMEYTTNHITYTPITDTTITNLVPNSYYIRVKATNTSFRSIETMITINNYLEVKESTPNVTINYESEVLLGLTINGYTINNDVVTTLNIDTSYFGTTLSIVKLGDGIHTTNSDPQTLIIPNRPSTPTPSGLDSTTLANNDGTILDVDTTMEYSLDTITYNPITNTSITNIPTPATYYLRVASTPTSFRSDTVTLTLNNYQEVKEQIPNVTINYLDETLIFDIKGDYIINNTLITITDDLYLDSTLFGTTLEIIKTGDGVYTIDSDTQELVIPDRPSAPTPTSINPTTLANNDGMIINVDDAMEYTIDHLTYISITDTVLINLVPNISYYIRVKATSTSFSSILVWVEIITYEPTFGTVGLKYELSDDETYYSVIGYDGSDVDIFIPSLYEGLPIKLIGVEAFAWLDIETVIFAEEIQLEWIDAGAFSECKKLKSIEIPNTVIGINDGAFAGCFELSEVVFEENSSLQIIGVSAFAGCLVLKSIDIPASVLTLNNASFAACISLETVTFEENSLLQIIGVNAFTTCLELKSIEIPASVIGIADGTFMQCVSLETVTFEEGSVLEIIGTYAFGECNNLREITIPSSIVTLGSSAFTNCKMLFSVVFETGSKITEIETSTFYGCTKLSSVNIPHGVSSIGNYAFNGCVLLQFVEIPNTVITIGEWAFAGCTISSLIIPNSVTSIKTYAFSNQSRLESLVFEKNSSLVEIGDYAFDGIQLLEFLIIPASVKVIGICAFRGSYNNTRFKSISFEAGSVLESIEGWAFQECYNLVVFLTLDTMVMVDPSLFMAVGMVVVKDELYDSYVALFPEYQSMIVRETEYNVL